ncbi:MAG TPA: hypothetical protein VKI19_04490 [Acidimicrobiales bacterium]|nr:hypothetical protein [Acidimicrobiales bacterium]
MTAHAELSSVATRLHELIARVTEIADGLAADEKEEVGSELFEVERTLRTAERRLNRVVGR